MAGTAGNGNGEEESQLLVMGRAWPTQYVAASALALTNPEWSITFLLFEDLTSAIVLLHCQIRWNTKRKWTLTIRTGYQFELVSVASHCDKLVEAKLFRHMQTKISDSCIIRSSRAQIESFKDARK